MEEIRAKTSKGVQSKTAEDHYSFRPFAPPKPIFLQPKRITIKLAHFRPPFMAQNLAHQQAQVWPDSAPPGLLLFFPSPRTLMSPAFGHALQVDNSLFLQPPYLLQSAPFSLLSHHFPLSSPMQTPITPLAHHFPLFPLLVLCMNSPLNALPTCSPCWQPLEDSSHGYKSHQEREKRGWSFSEKKG